MGKVYETVLTLERSIKSLLIAVTGIVKDINNDDNFFVNSSAATETD